MSIMGETCIYCDSTVNVYAERCEECAVTEFDNENAHGRSPMSQPVSLPERLHALEQYVPYGAGYDRAVADEFHTAARLFARWRGTITARKASLPCRTLSTRRVGSDMHDRMALILAAPTMVLAVWFGWSGFRMTLRAKVNPDQE
jgi:hypothetical protein